MVWILSFVDIYHINNYDSEVLQYLLELGNKYMYDNILETTHSFAGNTAIYIPIYFNCGG